MTIRYPGRGLCAVALAAAPLSLASPSFAAQGDGVELVDRYCSGCHRPQQGEQSWRRISDQRKTPEGWDMTIARMGILHGVQVPGSDRRALVKYLSDSRGLAPEESAPERALIERRLNRIESFDHPTFQEMCARCHTGGRVVLQRRPRDEWERLVNFHVGQYQTLEYQSNARDREWFDLALNDIVPWLSDQFPLESQAWSDWQQTPAKAPAGSWQMWGRWPGQGDFVAEVEIVPAEGADAYRLSVDGEFLDGRGLSGSGQAVVYTGYEWRAKLTLNGREFLQVLDLSPTSPTGRLFDDDDEAFGMAVTLSPVSEDGEASDAAAAGGDASTIAVVIPQALKSGSRQRLVIVGQGLGDGEVVLGAGVTVESIIERSASRLIAEVSVAEDAAPGMRAVSVAGGIAEQGLAVYDSVDRLEVQPELAVARVGAEQTPAVSGVFRALGYMEGPGGESIALGDVPVAWSVAPWDETAEADGDVRYAGVMDKAAGIFEPSGAGPNPDRKYDTNNAGNLRVTARVAGQDEEVADDAHLIVTVQRWNNPPLR